MTLIHWTLRILVLSSLAGADGFIQYNFGVGQDSNNQSTVTIQRSTFHEVSSYFKITQKAEFHLGISYIKSSSYQTESDNNSSTQTTNVPLISLRYYLNKNRNFGLTLQFSPIAKLYQATDLAAADWSGTAVIVKPGVYVPVKTSFQLAIELNYIKSMYSKKTALSGTLPDSNFSRTQLVPTAGLIWNL